MLSIKKIVSLVLVILVLGTINLFGQKGKGHGHHNPNHHRGQKRMIVKRSLYRPAKIIVYHPFWGPKFNHHRRWIFFPGHNIYWDHWRGHWVFWNGAMWISQVAKPAVIVNVNLESEKSRELKEDDDDVDDIYKNNETHKSEPK